MNHSRLSRNEITELRELSRSSSLRHESGRVLVEGYRSISGAARAGAKFRFILTTDHNDEKMATIAAEKIIVDKTALERISTTSSPQSALAICEMPVTTIDQIVSGHLSNKPIFVLDNVSDPGNVGTIVRSAVAFEIGAIVMVGGCDPFNPKAVRSSAGTIFACPIITIDEYQIKQILAGREVFSADSSTQDTLDSTKFPKNVAVVFGSEAHGIITPYFENNTHPFTVPMQELCESLNVAMTATIVAHHLHDKINRKNNPK